MPMLDVFHVGAIDLEGIVLHAPSDVNENPNHTIVRRHHAGRIAPSYSNMGSIMPAITFNTPEIGTALAKITKNGIEIVSSRIYYTRRKATANSNLADHLITSLDLGVIVPRTLSWNGGVAPWLLGVEIRPASVDGLSAPFIYTTAALPSLAEIPETYCGGKFLVNDEEVDCLQNMTLDWGMIVDQVLHKGLPAPVRAGVQEVKPALRFTNLNPADRAVFGQFGTRIESAVLYLRRNEAGVLTPTDPPHRVPDDVAEHIKLEFIAGIIAPSATVAPEDTKATQDFDLIFDETFLTAPASTDWVVITYNVAIP